MFTFWEPVDFLIPSQLQQLSQSFLLRIMDYVPCVLHSPGGCDSFGT